MTTPSRSEYVVIPRCIADLVAARPFETCDDTLRLAEELGVGTHDLKQIEVIGTPMQYALFKFREVLPPRA